jgi:ABC transporter substrate binding protein (PQQ-dependent alcohol dehydrogenase system)
MHFSSVFSLVVLGGMLLMPLSVVSAAKGKAAPVAAAQSPQLPVAPTVADTPVRLVLLRRADAPPATGLPYYVEERPSEGVQGARLGVSDNNTTGVFMHQRFELTVRELSEGEEAALVFVALVQQGFEHVLLDVGDDTLLKLASLPEAERTILYDVGSQSDQVRTGLCRPNLLHLRLSESMEADALAQYLAARRWNRFFLLRTSKADDARWGEAFLRAARRFGLKKVSEKVWDYASDDRRTPESEIPVLTQGDDYDVLVVADRNNQWADLLNYRTWSPKVVAGASGLSPHAWDFTLDNWGAIQLQRRFRSQAGYWMSDRDYASWLAVRALGEAALRTGNLQRDGLLQYMRGPSFALAGFKGVPLSFRSWDGQLRQPVLLTDLRSVVAVAPVPGFLHATNTLDTLGYDAPESHCHAP